MITFTTGKRLEVSGWYLISFDPSNVNFNDNLDSYGDATTPRVFGVTKTDHSLLLSTFEKKYYFQLNSKNLTV
jgi:hypothetical protein